MARVGPQRHRKIKGDGMKTVEDAVPVFGWPVKRTVEMVGVRVVKTKVGGLHSGETAECNEKHQRNRITTSGTDLNAVHPELKKNSKTGVLYRVILGNLTRGNSAATMNFC
jgi:hypothetical protein